MWERPEHWVLREQGEHIAGTRGTLGTRGTSHREHWVLREHLGHGHKKAGHLGPAQFDLLTYLIT